MSGIQLAPCELAGLVLESCLSGIALVMFFAATYVIVYKRGLSSSATTPFNKIIFTVTTVLFLCVMAHWITNIARAFDAFWYHYQDPGPNAIFGDLADPKNVIKTGIYIFEVILADSILIYRTYVVWGRKKWVIIIPLLTELGSIVCGTTITYVFSTLQPDVQVFASENGRWILSFLSFTLCTNLFATPMISYRIWRTNRPVQAMGAMRISPAIQIIMESAAIYALFTFLTFVLYLADSNVQFPTLDSTSPIIGIVFCLITVRTELGLAYGQTQYSAGSGSGKSHGRRPSLFRGSTAVGTNSNASRPSQFLDSRIDDPLDSGHPLRSLAVHITREVDVQTPAHDEVDLKTGRFDSSIGTAVDAFDYHSKDYGSDTSAV